MNKQQKIGIGIIAAGLVLVVAIGAIVMVTVGGGTSAYSSHMELAEQYLDDLKYEQAIAEYKAAIEVEPKNEEAYLALADIYVQQGDYETAIDVLNQGIDKTEEEKLIARLKELQEQYAEIEKTKEVESVVGGTENSGNVGSGRQEVLYYTSGAIWNIDEYDKNGNWVKSTWYSENGAVEFIWEYDENGNLVKATNYSESGEISSIEEMDENGTLTKGIRYYYHASGELWIISESGINGIPKKDTWYSENGAISSIREYDENGNCIKKTYYNEDGTIRGYDIREGDKMVIYDADGRTHGYYSD